MAARRSLDTRRPAREAGADRPRWESVGNLCPKHARRRSIVREIPSRRLCIASSRLSTERSRAAGRSVSSGSTVAGGDSSTGLSARTSTAVTSATGTLSQTAYHLRFSPAEITVIRRHHPLEGEQLEVLAERGRGLDVRLSDGTSMRIPRDWTDADGSPPGQPLTSEAVYSVKAVRELIELVRALRDRP